MPAVDVVASVVREKVYEALVFEERMASGGYFLLDNTGGSHVLGSSPSHR
jgi:hypothetical protein